MDHVFKFPKNARLVSSDASNRFATIIGRALDKDTGRSHYVIQVFNKVTHTTSVHYDVAVDVEQFWKPE